MVIVLLKLILDVKIQTIMVIVVMLFMMTAEYVQRVIVDMMLMVI